MWVLKNVAVVGKQLAQESGYSASFSANGQSSRSLRAEADLSHSRSLSADTKTSAVSGRQLSQESGSSSSSSRSAGQSSGSLRSQADLSHSSSWSSQADHSVSESSSSDSAWVSH